MPITVVNRKVFNTSASASPVPDTALGSGIAYNPAPKISTKAGSAAGSGVANAPTVTPATGFTDGRDVSRTNVGIRAGHTPTAYSGPDPITSNGTVVSDKILPGGLGVHANNVIFRDCLIEFGGDYGLYVGDWNQSYGAGFLMEYCEIRSSPGTGPDGNLAAGDRAVLLIASGCTFRYNYLHGSRRFFALFGDNNTVEWSWIGDNVNNTDGHTSAFGAWGGVGYMTIRGNNIQVPPESNASGCIQMYPENTSHTSNVDTANHHWLIEKNYLNTGGQEMITGGWTYPWESPNRSMTIRDNWWGDIYGTSPGDVAWSHLELNNYSDDGQGSHLIHAGFGDPWPNTGSWTATTGGSHTVPDHRGQATNPAPTSDMAHVWTNNRREPGGAIVPAPS